MKKMHVLALVAIVFSIVAGCKKDDATPDIVGLWNGTYDGTNPYHFLFRSNGTVRVLANDADTSLCDAAEGTYTVSDSVRATWTYPPSETYSGAAKLNSDATTMSGTYGNGSNTSGGGVFTLSR